MLGHRYYVPVLGRFLTQDPIGYAGGLNLYAYCSNNPMGAVDPDGTEVVVATRFKREYDTAKAYLTEKSQVAQFVFDYLENPNSPRLYIGAYNGTQQNINDFNRGVLQMDYFVPDYTKGIGYRINWAVNISSSWSYGKDRGSISPALILYHELLHAYHLFSNAGKSFDRSAQQMPIFDNAEERLTIKQERVAAKILGEGLRYHHRVNFRLVRKVNER